MQQYPNYLQAPIHSYTGMMTNPYMERVNQLQQYQQNMNTFSALGKIVESEDVVRATDIPMDGNMYFFPKADGSMIYGKQWMANGTTRLLAFKPILSEEPNNSTNADIKSENDTFNEIKKVFVERMESVEERLDRIENNIKQNKSKKGVEND